MVVPASVTLPRVTPVQLPPTEIARVWLLPLEALKVTRSKDMLAQSEYA